MFDVNYPCQRIASPKTVKGGGIMYHRGVECQQSLRPHGPIYLRHLHSALKLQMSPSCAGCTGSGGWDPGVSLSCFFYFLAIKGQFGHCLLKPAIFDFQFLQAPCLIDPEAAVLGPPGIEGLLRDTDAPGGLNNGTTHGDDHLRHSKLVDDFLGCVLPFGHVSTHVLSGILTLTPDQFSGLRSGFVRIHVPVDKVLRVSLVSAIAPTKFLRH